MLQLVLQNITNLKSNDFVLMEMKLLMNQFNKYHNVKNFVIRDKEEGKNDMSKTIIHSKIPTDTNGNYLLSAKQIADYADRASDILGDDYIFIVTPFEMNKIDGDDMLINIDCKEYSYNELMEIIEKAKMYDGLCK